MAVAQRLERLVVAQEDAGSNPVSHPTYNKTTGGREEFCEHGESMKQTPQNLAPLLTTTATPKNPAGQVTNGQSGTIPLAAETGMDQVDTCPPGAELVTVITVVDEHTSQESLSTLNDFVAGEGFEHLIVVDGPDEPDVPLVGQVLTTGCVVGTAAARNLGLAHATGEYITTAEVGDTLPASGMWDRATALHHNDQIGWVGGYLATNPASGTGQVIWKSKTRTGLNFPRDVFNAWDREDEEFPVAPETLMVRRDVLLAEGGWGGLPHAEDLCMALRVTSRHAGELLGKVVYKYGETPNHRLQISQRRVLDPACRSFCYQMGEALARLAERTAS